VIVMSEIPGITPLVASFARRVAAIGCTAVLPQLFGISGAEPTPRLPRSFQVEAAQLILAA
jgi:dienelactone hydrolase